MTREEEIIDAGIAYTMSTRPNVICGDAFAEDDLVRQLNRNKHFEAGAKWSDEHPINYDGKAFLYVNQKSHKNGYNEAVEKAIEWWEKHLPQCIEIDKDCVVVNHALIADFEEAMKGE